MNEGKLFHPTFIFFAQMHRPDNKNSSLDIDSTELSFSFGLRPAESMSRECNNPNSAQPISSIVTQNFTKSQFCHVAFFIKRI